MGRWPRASCLCGAAAAPGPTAASPDCRFPDTTCHDLTIPDGAVEVHVTITGDVFHASSLGQQIAHSVSVEITVPGEATRTVTLKSDGRTPLRLTLRYAVAGTGRTVSVRRAADPSDDERTSEEPSWSALAAGRRDTGSYGGQTRYAPRPTRRPPANSGGSAQSAARRCPGGRNNTWSAPEVSSNPAWIFRWYALGYATMANCWPASVCRKTRKAGSPSPRPPAAGRRPSASRPGPPTISWASPPRQRFRPNSSWTCWAKRAIDRGSDRNGLTPRIDVGHRSNVSARAQAAPAGNRGSSSRVPRSCGPAGDGQTRSFSDAGAALSCVASTYPSSTARRTRAQPCRDRSPS